MEVGRRLRGDGIAAGIHPRVELLDGHDLAAHLDREDRDERRYRRAAGRLRECTRPERGDKERQPDRDASEGASDDFAAYRCASAACAAARRAIGTR